MAARREVCHLVQNPGLRWKRIAALYEPWGPGVVRAGPHVSSMVVCVRWWRSRARSAQVSVVPPVRQGVGQQWVDGVGGQGVVQVACAIPEVQLQLLLLLQLQLAERCCCHGNVWHDVGQVAVTTGAALGLRKGKADSH